MANMRTDGGPDKQCPWFQSHVFDFDEDINLSDVGPRRFENDPASFAFSHGERTAAGGRHSGQIEQRQTPQEMFKIGPQTRITQHRLANFVGMGEIGIGEIGHQRCRPDLSTSVFLPAQHLVAEHQQLE